MSNHTEHAHHSGEGVHLPSPTAWPLVLALGITLCITGLVTHWAVSLLGLVLTLMASVGWFRQVLPHEKHEMVEIHEEELAIKSMRKRVVMMPVEEAHRTVYPVETYSITAGVKGGIAGGLAMTVPAVAFGLIAYHSIWYPINLLAAGVFNSWGTASTQFLMEFHLKGLIVAAIIHGLTSVLVGLLYGVMLPMFPRRPILTAGFVAPLLWTGLLYSVLGLVNPVLNSRIHWLWFILSQAAFGLVTGFVVNLQVKVRTPQFQSLPFALRAGVEATGLHGEDEENH